MFRPGEAKMSPIKSKIGQGIKALKGAHHTAVPVSVI